MNSFLYRGWHVEVVTAGRYAVAGERNVGRYNASSIRLNGSRRTLRAKRLPFTKPRSLLMRKNPTGRPK